MVMVQGGQGINTLASLSSLSFSCGVPYCSLMLAYAGVYREASHSHSAHRSAFQVQSRWPEAVCAAHQIQGTWGTQGLLISGERLSAMAGIAFLRLWGTSLRSSHCGSWGSKQRLSLQQTLATSLGTLVTKPRGRAAYTDSLPI